MALDLPRWTGGETDARDTLEVIDRWATGREMTAIVDAFDGDCAGVPADRMLQWLGRFSAAHWDFRGGRERNLAAEASLSPAQERTVMSVAPLLGLAPSRPSRTHYDVALMTGGMVRAGIVKPRFLRELLDDGLSVGSAVFLGGFREFAGDETALARGLGVEGDNEFDAMEAGLRQTFAPLGEPEVAGESHDSPNASWWEHSWPADGDRIPLSVLAAPSSLPQHRRANTVDTYRFWAERRRAPEQRSVLVITTPIYVPYQAAGAVEVLGLDYGLAVETVGVSDAASDLGHLSQPVLAQHCLQEVRSGIRGMESLRYRLVGAE